jgi:CrcB protein
MTPYLLVGFGGACGSLVRFALNKVIVKKTKHAFPFSTLIINISGALLLGLIANMASIGPHWLLLLADGFLGAYTTFSTFMYEGFTLFHGRKALNAAVYIGGTVLLGLAAYMLGAVAARFI